MNNISLKMQSFLQKHELSEQQIRKKAPAVFATAPAHWVSERYTFLRTYEIVNWLKLEGWKVIQAKQINKVKEANLLINLHMVTLVDPFHPIAPGDLYPQIVLANGHTGYNAFRLNTGIFQLSTEIGLRVNIDELQDLYTRHISYTFEDMQQYCRTIINNLAYLRQKIETFSAKRLSRAQTQRFAEQALLLKQATSEKRELCYDELLNGLGADGDSLWKTYEHLQRKFLRSEYYYYEDGTRTPKKANSIVGLKKNIAFNESMYALALKFLEENENPNANVVANAPVENVPDHVIPVAAPGIPPADDENNPINVEAPIPVAEIHPVIAAPVAVV